MFISILKKFFFEKMTKKSGNDVSGVVGMAIGDVAMFFCLCEIYRFVALEKLYRTSKARKIFIATLEAKISFKMKVY